MPKSQCLQKALNYIDRNLTKDLNLYDISSAAGFSVPHFYRLFKSLTGDTVYAYVLRCRLSVAAKQLIDNNRPIAEIAYHYGFESHDVFTRAFRRMYGITPIQYRKRKGVPPLKRIEVLNCDPVSDQHQMKFSVLRLKGFYVIGMEGQAMQWDSDGAVGRLWNDFLGRINEIEEVSDPFVMYGICEHEFCKKETLKYLAAIGVDKVDKLPEGMVKRYIRPHSFFRASVPDFISVPDAYAGAIGYAKSLGYRIEDYDNIEVYNEKFNDPEFHKFHLLIPIRE
jgi:AraC family transcriptional regulator